jgi:hypothetical protein
VRGPAFTPGPWIVETDNKNRPRTFVTAQHPQGRVIVCQTGFGHGVEENRANSHLIVAAPELYEALKAFATCWTEEEIEGAPNDMAVGDALHAPSQPTVGDLRRTLAALAKARGEQP